MPKTDKELATELMCAYLSAIYSRNTAPITADMAKEMFSAFYEAVKGTKED